MATSTSLDTRTYDGGLTRRDVVRWRNSVFVIFALSGFGISTWLGRVPSVRDILHASTIEMGFLAGASASAPSSASPSRATSSPGSGRGAPCSCPWPWSASAWSAAA
ncbi:hypothetical protein AX769_04545 [Frondihabitans sp. PAMC 28766]|uniref:hypothetical protein n=1 Tax=Frondihabitans sp. PAMC 28766 TaxID=1795630 RepID=UPI00078B6EB5|nr:hypothetical protein [Frondihabitans sp. PAMC 28766]AMM19542.1 hypothetical protein AX769_04545 [Frondihabitans sp. PAMC 28766]